MPLAGCTLERNAGRKMQTHRGRIKLADGDEVDVDLEMTDESIRLATDATEIGTWARAEFRIVPLGDGVFEIVIDGDRVAFEPLDVEPFEASMIRVNGFGPGTTPGGIDEAFQDASDTKPVRAEAEELETFGTETGGAGLEKTPAPEGLEQHASGMAEATEEIDPVEHAFGSGSLESDVDLLAAWLTASDAEAGDAPAGTVTPPKDEISSSSGAGSDDGDDRPLDHHSLSEDAEDAIDGRWAAGDVFLDDAGTVPAEAIEGHDVAAWALVTPAGEIEGGWAHERDAGDEEDRSSMDSDSGDDAFAVTDSRVGGGDEPDSTGEGWSLSRPRWSVVETETADAAEDSGDRDTVDYGALEEALAELDQPGDGAAPEAESSGEAAVPNESAEARSGPRFGGSSVERLAAAVGALKSNRPLTPAEEALAAAAAEDDEAASSVADGILASQRSLRQTTVVTRITWDLVRKVGAGVLLGIGIAAVVVLAPNAWDVLTRETGTPVTTIQPGEVPTTVTAVSTTTTTAAAEATTTTAEPVSVPTVFDLPAPQFVQTWNDVARPIDEVLTFAALPPIGEFENEFFSHLSMLGVVGPDGTVDRFSLVIDPTGPANSDRLGIQSLGVALKVMDPGSTGSSRAALLRSLGLDVNEPNLAGIDSSLDVDGIRYSLRYDPESVTLTLSVAPIGPGGE